MTLLRISVAQDISSVNPELFIHLFMVNNSFDKVLNTSVHTFRYAI